MRDHHVALNEPVKVKLATEKLGLLASLKVARRNILEIIPQASTRMPVVSGQTGGRWHMITDADALREMLLDKLDQYPKSVVTKNLLEPAIGESLFIAEGEQWRWQRRAAAPVFAHRNIMNLAPIMTRAADNSVARIAKAGPRAVNLLDEMIAATFDVISDVTFSGNTDFDRGAVHRAIDDYIEASGKISILDMLNAPAWIPRPSRTFSKEALHDMKDVADRSIEERAACGPEDVPDLLDLLMGGEDPKSGRTMTTAEIRDNLLAFIVAGHETTALSLAWSLYLLAFDQEVQDRARAEAQAVLQGRSATGEDVEHLPLIRQIIDEALRLYPPGGMVSRTAQADDTLAGARIRKGDTCIIPIYALHRSHLYWDDPDAFRPERFADRKAIQRYTYLPFGDGPRICIGMAFALQEAVIILATLISKFRFAPVKGRDPDPVMILTLRPEGGVWLMAEPAEA